MWYNGNKPSKMKKQKEATSEALAGYSISLELYDQNKPVIIISERVPFLTDDGQFVIVTKGASGIWFDSKNVRRIDAIAIKKEDTSGTEE